MNFRFPLLLEVIGRMRGRSSRKSVMISRIEPKKEMKISERRDE